MEDWGGGCWKQVCECELYEQTRLSLFSSSDNFSNTEFLSDIAFEICGLRKFETVKITVESPNGSVEYHEIASFLSDGGRSGYMIDFEYTPTLPSSPGMYYFHFSGSDWVLEKFVEVKDATGPRLFLDTDNMLTFYKFQPNENVRLLAYNNGILIGWKQLKIGAEGTLQIHTNIRSNFIALGELSGQVFDKHQGDNPSQWVWLGTPTDVFCRGANPSGIKALGNVEILVESLPTYKYDWNSYSVFQHETIIGKRGRIAQVVSNAICHEDNFLWKICLDEDCDLYVPEFSSGIANIRLTTQPVETILPQQGSDIPVCPGTLPTRLSVGMRAEVTTSGMAPQLSLRSQPSMSADRVHVIAAGRDLVILDGPVCADGSYWWYIRSEQGFEGWSREGDHEDYWIDPLP